jgi:hypothetical protein
MRTVMVMDLSAPNQLTFDSHKFAGPTGLNMENCHEELMQRLAPHDRDGNFISPGFLRPQITVDCVSSIMIYQKKVGAYTEAVYDIHSDDLSEKEHDDYYFKQAIVQFHPKAVVAFMSGVTDKSAVRNTVEGIVHEWGFEARLLRLTPERLHDLARKFRSLSMTIDHIEIDMDGTKKVKFEVDPARGADSKVQVLYEGEGDIAQLKAIITYENQGYWVKIYPDGLLALDDDNLPLDEVEAYAYHVIRQVFGRRER